jgi:hypothetical protein
VVEKEFKGVDEKLKGEAAGVEELEKADPVLLVEKENPVGAPPREEDVPGKVNPDKAAPVEGVDGGNRELLVDGFVEKRLLLGVLLNIEPVSDEVVAGVLDGNERLGKNEDVAAPLV